MEIEALIQAAGSGARLGLGPKAFVMLDGRTLLERACDLFRGVAGRITVSVAPADMERARALLGGDVVIVAGGASRSETTRRLVAAAKAPWLLLHDVVHPFAGDDLIGRVLAAAYAHRVAAPAIANTEFLYSREGVVVHPPGAVLVGQKPVAFARDAAEAAFAAAAATEGDPSLMELFARIGIPTHFVEGSATNIKITVPADLTLAALMILRESAVA